MESVLEKLVVLPEFVLPWEEHHLLLLVLAQNLEAATERVMRSKRMTEVSLKS